MAITSTIILRNGTSSAVPSSLTHGEPAINVTTGLLYYGSGSGNIVKTFSNFTHVTASGNISSSGGNITANFPDTNVDAAHYPTVVTGGDATLESQNSLMVNPSTNTTTAGILVATTNVTASQFEGNTLFTTGSHTVAGSTAEGDIVKFSDTSTTAGQVYALMPDGGWNAANCDNNLASTSSLAMAIGTNSTTHGMLLRGMIKVQSDPDCGIGQPVYLTTTGGRLGCVAPQGNNDIARIAGFYMSGSGVIYFNPDNTSIQVSA